jgi:hypothetical protein
MTPIKSFGNFLIDKTGTIKSLHTGLICIPQKNTHGYYHVTIEGKPRLVHRLVAQTFIPNPAGFECVNHKNGNKLDNRVENLEWCTRAENNRHARGLG